MEGYNLRYVLKYCNKDGVPLRINIKWRGYTGNAFVLVDEDRKYLLNSDGDFVVVEKEGEYDPDTDASNVEGSTNPFTLKYYSDRDDKSAIIRATGASMSFFENNVFNIDDMLTSEETDILVEFYYGGEIEWMGFVVPDFFYNEITKNPIINLTASDRLGVLKDISYPVDEYIDTNTRVNYFTIIKKCLDSTGLILPINVLCGHICKEWDSGGIFQHAFLKTFVSEYRFIEGDNKIKDCYSVLQSICQQFNCYVTQYKAQWWVVNKVQRSKGLGNIVTFDINGNAISNRPFEKETIQFSSIYTGGQRSIIPVGALNTIIMDHGREMPYPENGNFQRWLGSRFAGWTEHNGYGSALTYDRPLRYNTDGSILSSAELQYHALRANVRPNFQQYTLEDVHIRRNSPYLQSEKISIPNVQSNYIKIDLSISGSGLNWDRLHFYVVIDTNVTDGSISRYWAWDGWRFTSPTDQADNTFKPIGNSIDGSGDFLPYKTVFRYRDTNIDDRLAAVEIRKQVRSGVMNYISGVEFGDMDLYIRYYGTLGHPTNAFNTFRTGEYDNIIQSVELSFDVDQEYPKATAFQNEVVKKFTKKTDRGAVLFGDYQTEGRNGFFYPYRDDSLSIQYTEDGRMTKNWRTVDDGTDLPLLEHTVNEITKSWGRAHNELRISFDTDRVTPIADIEVSCPNSSQVFKYVRNKKYLLLEGDMDYMRNVFTGTVTEDTVSSVDYRSFIYSVFDDNDIR